MEIETIGNFIISKDDIEMARVRDMDGAGDAIRYFVKAGYQVDFNPGNRVEIVNAMPRDKPELEAEQQPSEYMGWKMGEHCYLKWSVLPEASQFKYSSYRNVKGTVTEIRTGRGVRYNLGVRFNSDPELVWLKAGDIDRVPEVD
ncbi:MAG: hypothetical protein M0Z43_00255 [Acidithiobacillus sp.]|nr:hypothetical protein [Acidithiobacillus sp.]